MTSILDITKTKINTLMLDNCMAVTVCQETGAEMRDAAAQQRGQTGSDKAEKD